MAEKLDPRQVVTFGRLVVVLLALAVVGVGCSTLTIESRTHLEAWIYDVTKAHMAGHVSENTSGLQVMFADFGTESQVCNSIGDAVAKFLSGEDPDVWVGRGEPPQIESHDAITVVLGQFGEEFSSTKKRKFTSCITRAFHEAHPTVRIVPPEEFHQVVPAFSTDQLGDPALREQIAPLGIRYLILMEGSTVTW